MYKCLCLTCAYCSEVSEDLIGRSRSVFLIVNSDILDGEVRLNDGGEAEAAQTEASRSQVLDEAERTGQLAVTISYGG